MSGQQVQVTRQGGIGIVGVLTILFVTLKLLNVITWSWWWVLSPLWISFGLSILGLIGLALVVLIVAAFASSKPTTLRRPVSGRAPYRGNRRR
jgi:hypothetical protein